MEEAVKGNNEDKNPGIRPEVYSVPTPSLPQPKHWYESIPLRIAGGILSIILPGVCSAPLKSSHLR